MTFRQIRDAAVDDCRLSSNPAARVSLPSDGSRSREWMSVAQAQALRDSIAPEYRVVVLLGYWCGLRLGEIAAIRRQDIDVARNRIRVERTAPRPVTA